jgi:hypothetical protein
MAFMVGQPGVPAAGREPGGAEMKPRQQTYEETRTQQANAKRKSGVRYQTAMACRKAVVS